jgi:hypothetical protein
MHLVVTQHVSGEVRHEFQHPEPEQKDVEFLEEVRGRLVEGISSNNLMTTGAPDEAALALACRLRLFLREMDRLTGWSIDHVGYSNAVLAHHL